MNDPTPKSKLSIWAATTNLALAAMNWLLWWVKLAWWLVLVVVGLAFMLLWEVYGRLTSLSGDDQAEMRCLA